MKQTDSDVLKAFSINSKGYGMFPKMVSQDQRLTIEAKGIYAYFCSCSGSDNSEFPIVSAILSDLVMGEERYRKHLKLLIKHGYISVSYTHLRAHETRHDLVCRLLLEKKKKNKKKD